MIRIPEEFVTAIPFRSMYFNGVVELFVNPSMKELREIENMTEEPVRGIITVDGDFYTVLAEDIQEVGEVLIHADIIRIMQLTGVSVIRGIESELFSAQSKYYEIAENSFLAIMQSFFGKRDFILSESYTSEMADKLREDGLLIRYKERFEAKNPRLELDITR